MSMFNTEFSLGNSFSAYRGKGNVPASGPISFSQLYGATASVTVSAVVQDAGFGSVAYVRTRSPTGVVLSNIGSLSAQPFPDMYLTYFGTNAYPRVGFQFEGDTRTTLSGKKFIVDGVEVAFNAIFSSGQGYSADYTYYESIANRPAFAVGSTHTLTFA